MSDQPLPAADRAFAVEVRRLHRKYGVVPTREDVLLDALEATELRVRDVVKANSYLGRERDAAWQALGDLDAVLDFGTPLQKGEDLVMSRHAALNAAFAKARTALPQEGAGAEEECRKAERRLAIRGLGNAVVPAVAEYIGRMIMEGDRDEA